MNRHIKTAFLLTFVAANLALIQSAHATFLLTAAPRRGGQNIRFESGQPGGILRNEEVSIQVATDRGAQYRIYQTVYQPLTNEFGNAIPQGKFFMFSPSSSLGVLKVQMETPITMGQQPIYVSNNAGDSDTFVLVYNVNVPEDQPGGVYHTQLQLAAELVSQQGGVSPSIVTVDVRVEINPKFRVTIKTSKAGRNIDLGAVTKDRPVATEDVLFGVESNIGTTYRIVQQLTEPLVSKEGTMLDEAAMSFVQEGAKNGTMAAVGGAQPLDQKPKFIYTSSDKGAGDAFQIQYRFASDKPQKAGEYNGNLTFRVESNSAFVPQEVYNYPIRVQVDPIFYLDVETDQGQSRLHFGVFKTGDEKQQRRVKIKVNSNLGAAYQVTQVVSRKLTNQKGQTIPKESFTVMGMEAKTGVLAARTPIGVMEGESPIYTSDKNGAPDEFSLVYNLELPQDTKSGSYSTEVRYSLTTL